MNFEDADAVRSDEFPTPDDYAEMDAEAEIAALQRAQDRHVIWLCDNGREDDNVDGGMSAWFYKALYLAKP